MTSAAARQVGRLGWLAVLLILVTACERSPEPGAERPSRPPATTATEAAPAGLRVQEYPVPAGSRTHDVAPAADGRSVWYTAQGSGQLGLLDPATGKSRLIPLGGGSAPHGVIVGPDGAPWITDGGLNAIVRVDPRTEKVDRYPLPPERGSANLNTAAGARAPTASPPLPTGSCSTPPWPAATSAASTTGRAPPRCWSRPHVTRAPGGSGPTPAAGSG